MENDNTFEKKHEFRDNFLDIVRDKYLVIVKFDGSFNRIIFHIDLREVKDTL